MSAETTERNRKQILTEADLSAEPIPIEPRAFFGEINREAPEGTSTVPCIKKYKDDADPSYWGFKPRRWMVEEWEQKREDIYFTLSAMRFPPDAKPGSYVEKTYNNFAAGLVVGLDDVGTGGGAKVGFDALRLPPSCVIETSADCYQAAYFLNAAMDDVWEFKNLADAMATIGDEGAKNPVRLFRAPFGFNKKPERRLEDGRPFPVALRLWEPERRYSAAQIKAAFGIRLIRPEYSELAVGEAEAAYAKRRFFAILTWLSNGGYLLFPDRKRILPPNQTETQPFTYADYPSPTKRQAVLCPICGEPDAVIFWPHERNGGWGQYRCMHLRSCEEIGLKDLAELALNEVDERKEQKALEAANADAANASDFIGGNNGDA